MRNAHGRPVLIGRSENGSPLESVRLGEGERAFDEAWLQRLISDHPEILPVHQIEPGFGELVSVCREFPTRHGPVDNLLMTREGNLLLVEVKLWRNPEARRKVVAQALDYASCLFEMDYAELERAVLKAKFGNGDKPKRLYDLFRDEDTKDERAFIDAVHTNLRKGRVLILVVGDGIRTETQRLAELVQSHAGAHFTFALVELAIFRMPDGEHWLVCPRTLARTEMISRAIVEIDDRRTKARLPEQLSSAKTVRHPETISAEQFYEAIAKRRSDLPDRFRVLIGQLEPLGVYPDFQRALSLRWDPPSGKSVNLGYIQRNGQLWTTVSGSAPTDLSRLYNEELAAALGTAVEKERFGGNWHLRVGDHAPRIEALADKLDRWPPVAERFITRIQERLSQMET